MALLLTLALVFPPALAHAPMVVSDSSSISADSWVVFDEGYDSEVAFHNPDRRAAMASTTKLMTALLVVEIADLSDTVTVSRRAEATGHKQIWLRQGDEWVVEELLEALMVVSANDAAVALAEHIGGDVSSFVALMNQRAFELGMADTSFANPHGLDAADHYTTAHDLLVLARRAMESPVLARMAAQSEAIVVRGDGTATTWESTNELLDTFDGAIGLKTGWTTGAGDVLVAVAERNDRRIYAVVMGSEDASRDAARLLEDGFAAIGPAERRLVPLMEDRQQVAERRQSLALDALTRVGHLRCLALWSSVSW